MLLKTMVPAIYTPVSQSALANVSVAPAAILPSPSQTSNNVLLNAVQGNISPLAVRNNVTSGGGTVASVQQASQGGESITPPQHLTRASSQGLLPMFGFSSAFLTQAISQQSAANDNRLFLAFDYLLPNSLTPGPELLAQFAETKYLPSNAARPVPDRVAESVSNQDLDATPGRISASSDAPLQPSLNETSSDDSAFAFRAEVSLIRSQGSEAYVATSSRNADSISSIPAQAVAA